MKILRLSRNISGFTGLLLLIACSAIPAEGQAADSHDGSFRHGFTLSLSLGTGMQNDVSIPNSASGLGGLNFGIGGFLSEDLAILFRFSSTTVEQTADERGAEREFDQTSGVGGASLQYWLSNRLNLEFGMGFGFRSETVGRRCELYGCYDVDDEDMGAGLLLAAGYTLFNRRRNDLQLVLEYAPAFVKGGMVHNAGLCFAYQLL